MGFGERPKYSIRFFLTGEDRAGEPFAVQVQHAFGVRTVGVTRARQIGLAMRDRALRDHTYALRAASVQEILQAAEAYPFPLARSRSLSGHSY
jgi:mRNA-degrading endonuclease toxin of MazEF toxin-antitoxin module